MEQLLKLAKALQNVSTSSEFYFDSETSGALERQIAQAKEDICRVIGDKLEDIIRDEIDKLKTKTQ